MAFNITPLDAEFLTRLLGNTPGLSNFSATLVGDRRAFGNFQDDPFKLKSGIVLSTGQVADLTGKNSSDGGFSPGRSIPLTFKKLPGTAGNPTFPTGVYYADLAKLDIDVRSLLIADSNSGKGGAGGKFSGFDLDAIKISNTLVSSASEVDALPGLNVFDFSAGGTTLIPGTQRLSTTLPYDVIQPELDGVTNGVVNNSIATLGRFDADGSVVTRSGAVSLGDGGKIAFDLKSALPKGSPLYLYIGESGDNGEVTEGSITVSNRSFSGLNDLSTDFGLPGAQDDTITLQIDFDADASNRQLFFQYVFGSEELAEYAGKEFNDEFSLELNGLNLAKLSNNSTVSINNLSQNPFDRSNPDYIYNPVKIGPTSNFIRLDGYTKPVLFSGELIPGERNSLTITIKDTRDGLLDSAVFLRGGTLGTVRPSDNLDGPIYPEDNEVGGKNNPIDAGNGAGTITVTPGKTTYIKNFGGVGRGTQPDEATILNADTLKFGTPGFAAKNLLLTQTGTDLDITFEGDNDTKVVLKDFQLQLLDNLRQNTGSSVDLGNILFSSDLEIQDSFDVFNIEWQNGNPGGNPGHVLNRNTVTFLNDLNNDIAGFDSSDDVINGQGGNDFLSGLGGNDILRGGTGNDTLSGGTGSNILTGNEGADVFVISLNGTSTVTDFTLGQDLIGLSTGLTIEQLKIEQGTGIDSSSTWIKLASNDSLLLTLKGVIAADLNTAVFLPSSGYPGSLFV